MIPPRLSRLPVLSGILASGLIICVAFYYFYLILHSDAVPESFLTVNIMVTFLSLYFILRGDLFPFSLYSVFYVFSLIFYGLIPLFEYVYNIKYWGNTAIVFELYTYGNILCLISIMVFHISYRMFIRMNIRNNTDISITRVEIRPNILLSLSILSAFTILYINNFSLLSMFVRGGIYSNREFDSGIQFLIYQYVIFPIPAISVVVYMLYGKRDFLYLSLLLIIFLIFNPATGMARFQAATLYIAVMSAFIPVLLRIKYLFVSAIVFGLFFINPIINQFRIYNNQDLSFEISWSFLSSGEFDSFQNFASALYLNNITYGRQLIGVLLFFIPRSIWSDKPIGSGAQIANELGFSFSTISMNILGEGYINFGIFGIFLFVIIISFATSKFDYIFWVEVTYNKTIINVFSLFMFGLLFLILRGDLLSSFAYSLGMLFSVSLTWLLAVRRRRLRA